MQIVPASAFPSATFSLAGSMVNSIRVFCVSNAELSSDIFGSVLPSSVPVVFLLNVSWLAVAQARSACWETLARTAAKGRRGIGKEWNPFSRGP